MMKRVAGVLLLANLMLAGFFIGQEHWPHASSETMLPMNVDRLSLRSQSVHAAQKAVSLVPEVMCVEWRGLTPEEFSQVREQLKAMVAERVMSFAEVPLDTRRWVIFPPCPVRNRRQPS